MVDLVRVAAYVIWVFGFALIVAEVAGSFGGDQLTVVVGIAAVAFSLGGILASLYYDYRARKSNWPPEPPEDP